MTKKYQPKDFEKKWLKIWKKEKINDFNIVNNKNPAFAPPSPEQLRRPSKASAGKKYYVLVELPYTSGDLHIGHWFTFTVPDVLARYKRMNSLNVFFPNGYDAFGLPAENAAIKHKIHPRDWTMKNIEMMTKQYHTMGTMIDWKSMVITCLPEFYRWNQWIFLKMYEKGLIYRNKALSNWCEKDRTVLANENIENGRCWRCGNQIVQKEVEQWFIKITEYADKLIWSDKPTVDWPMSVRTGQNNWIDKSEGLLINFDGVEVFTTRSETADGASFVVLAPEHPLITKFTTEENKQKVENYITRSLKKTEMERKANKEKTGVATGGFVINPVTGKKIPVWVADYVLINYGTGAIMAVPAEDERDREFAIKNNLPIPKTSLKAKPVGKTKSIYHLRDWSISRQRYWGTPVPMIHCQKCGIVPVPEKDLPVELPYEVDFTPKGKPPLASNEKWLKVNCPKCGKEAKRDAETLDTFFDSSWYWFRYVSPDYDKGPFDREKVKKLTPVDIYFGGAEHTLGHTLYARFFTKFFKDIGLVDYDEFALKRVQHGIILGSDNNKMSKSKGNVVNPDDVIAEYGADAVRMYLCFMMPYEGTGPWSNQTIAGVYRFLKRVWDIYYSQYQKSNIKNPSFVPLSGTSEGKQNDKSKIKNNQLINKLNKTIIKVSQDIQNIKMNTAIAAMMEFLNAWEKNVERSTLNVKQAKQFLQLLAPFAPFTTEEIWRTVFGEKTSIHLSDWPKVEGEIIEENVVIPVQVNGKLRETLNVKRSTLNKEKLINLALKSEKIQKYLSGQKYKTIYIPGKILNFVLK